MCSFALLAALAAGLSGPQTSPQPTPPDPVGVTLKASGLIHTDIGGFYKLTYNYTDSKRKQDAFIRKNVFTYNSVSYQEAYAIFFESKTAPDAELLKKIFVKSFTIGGLILEEPSATQEYWRMRYKIDVPISVTAERLKQYLMFVAGTADGIEKELGSEDRL